MLLQGQKIPAQSQREKMPTVAVSTLPNLLSQQKSLLSINLNLSVCTVYMLLVFAHLLVFARQLCFV